MEKDYTDLERWGGLAAAGIHVHLNYAWPGGLPVSSNQICVLSLLGLLANSVNQLHQLVG